MVSVPIRLLWCGMFFWLWGDFCLWTCDGVGELFEEVHINPLWYFFPFAFDRCFVNNFYPPFFTNFASIVFLVYYLLWWCLWDPLAFNVIWLWYCDCEILFFCPFLELSIMHLSFLCAFHMWWSCVVIWCVLIPSVCSLCGFDVFVAFEVLGVNLWFGHWASSSKMTKVTT
jgi:hypothetical protein